MWIVVADYTSIEAGNHSEVLAIRATEALARIRMIELASSKGKINDCEGTLFVDEGVGEWMYHVELIEDIG